GKRPIGPPQDPVGKGFDDPPGKRYDVLIVRRTTLREPVGAAHFRPDVGMLAHQLDEQFELWSVHGLRYVWPPHMVHDHRRGEGCEESIELRQLCGLEVNDDVPPERRDAPRD